MKRIHLLQSAAGPEALADLIAAARAAGLRIGWLDLSAPPPATPLDAAAAAGASRAVAVGAGRAVSVKHTAGPPVLRDLLREHFPGCALVVVRPGDGGPGPEDGAPDGPGAELAGLPLLEPAGEGWRVVRGSGSGAASALELTTAELVARLRRARPW